MLSGILNTTGLGSEIGQMVKSAIAPTFQNVGGSSDLAYLHENLRLQAFQPYIEKNNLALGRFLGIWSVMIKHISSPYLVVHDMTR